MHLLSLYTTLLIAMSCTCSRSLYMSTFQPQTKCIIEKEPTTSTSCVPIQQRRAFATILPRIQRLKPDEVSLSPPTLPPNQATTHNHTKHNDSTSPNSHTIPPPPAWVLTLEDLITAIFRIVITTLTLFNVNITWRIRGEYSRSAAYHACANAHTPNS